MAQITHSKGTLPGIGYIANGSHAFTTSSATCTLVTDGIQRIHSLFATPASATVNGMCSIQMAQGLTNGMLHCTSGEVVLTRSSTVDSGLAFTYTIIGH